MRYFFSSSPNSKGVGASDLLPEAHRRFNLRMELSTLAGGGLIPLLGILLSK